MSEVVKLQLIGLTVVGMGIVILLFVRSQFARVIGFVAIVLGLFSLVGVTNPPSGGELAADQLAGRLGE